MNLNMRHYKSSIGLGATASNPGVASSCFGWSWIDQSNCFNEALANWYGLFQYGSTPNAVAAQPPNVPVTDSSGLITATTPAQIAQEQSSMDATTATQQAAINTAIASGAYTPGGNLPVTATGVSDFLDNPLSPTNTSTTLIIVALGIGAIFLFGSKK